MADLIPKPEDMPHLTQEEMDRIHELHAMFLCGRNGGARAVVKYKRLDYLNFRAGNFTNADFSGSSMIGAHLSGCIFNSANFFGCDMSKANIQNCDLKRADLRGALLSGANLTQSDMTNADLRQGQIMERGEEGMLITRDRGGEKSAKTVFRGAKLTDTIISGAQAQFTDFTDADLSGTEFKRANIEGALLNGANLTDTDFTGSNMAHTDLQSCIMAGTVMDNVEKDGMDTSDSVADNNMGSRLEQLGKTLPELLEDHDLWVSSAGKKGKQLNLSGYDLRDVLNIGVSPLTAIRAIGACFINQNFEFSELQSAILDHSDFRDCNMHGVDLRGSSLKSVSFNRADLSEAKLCPLHFGGQNNTKHIKRVDLTNANFRYANLKNTDLRDAILMGADLSYANLSGCNLRRADLSGAILTGVSLEHANLEDTIIDLKSI